MNRTECAREPEVLRVKSEGGWPDRCDAEMKAHLAVCGVCADLIEVAALLSNDREASVREVTVPGSGVAWWRTQMRLRQDARRRSQRRIAAVQAALVGAGLFVGAVVLGATSMPPQDGLGSIWHLCAGVDLGSIARMVPWSAPLGLALVAWLAVGPLAVRLALADDSND